jgi:predicted KAP-like P-loop ATPase
MNKSIGKLSTLRQEEHFFSSERPIRTLDEDELGRKGFATAVAKVIAQWTGHDSLVLAIYGPWGSGKSSIKNMILDALTQLSAKTISLEFNPWEWAGQEKVFEGFFGELSAKLGSSDISKKSEKTAKKMRMYGAKLSAAGFVTSGLRVPFAVLLYLIALAGLGPIVTGNVYIVWSVRILAGLAFIGASILTWSGGVADKLALYLTAKAEATRRSVTEAKEELQHLLQAFRKNVLVVVDDVDRLTPEGVRMVVQLVKANADFPNLIYLLLLQRDTIETALGEAGKVDGAQFLEKVVQVGFDIPTLSATKLEEYLETAISRSVGGTPADRKFDRQRWGKLFVSAIRPYFRTLRDVKRFSSMLSFHFELYKNGDSFDANPIDLIALEVLRQFEPSVYQRLYVAKELLTGRSRSPLGSVQSPEKKQAAKALLASAKRPNEAEAILVNVFPPLARALVDLKGTDTTSQPHNAAFRGEWLRDLRPCHPDMFERYFRFSLSGEELSESELVALLSVTGDRESFVRKLTELNEKGLLGAAVVALGVNSQLISNENPVPFATGLLDMERELFRQRVNRGVAEVPIDMQAVFIIRSVLQKRPVETRGPALREAITQTTALYLPMISFESSEKERQESIDPLVSEGEAKSLQELCVEKIRGAQERGELLSHPWFRYILQFWSKWGSQEEVSTWFAVTSDSDSGLLSLLQAFIEPMNLIDHGRILTTEYRFALEEFARYMKPDDVTERIRRLASSKTEHEAVYRLFLRAFDRWKETGQTPYPQNLGEWTTLEHL